MTPRLRTLGVLMLAISAGLSSPAGAENGTAALMPPVMPFPGMAPQVGLAPGLLAPGMLLPYFPGVAGFYPMAPSPYTAYPSMLFSYPGSLPMTLPSLPPGLATGLLPPQMPAGAPVGAGLETGPGPSMPMTGFQLPAIGNMTELPPLVPAEVQSLDPPMAALPSPTPAPANTAAAPTLATNPSTVTQDAPAAAPVVTPAPTPATAPSLVAAPAMSSPAVAPSAPTPPGNLFTSSPLPLPFPFPFAPYAAPAPEPTTPSQPYSVRRVVSQQEKSQLMQMAMPLMTGMMRMSLADTVNYFATKYKAKPGLAYDQVVEAMKRRATALGMQAAGEQRLTPTAKDGASAGPRIEVYSFWDANLGTELLKASPEFVVFLPGRVAVLEDGNKDIWVMSLDWNPEWVMGYKDKLAISDALWKGAVDMRERLDAILRAAADGT